MHDPGLLSRESIKRKIQVISVIQQSDTVRDIHPPPSILKRSSLRSQSICHAVTFSKNMQHHNLHSSSFPDGFQPLIPENPRNLARAIVVEINNRHRIWFDPYIRPVEFHNLINSSYESKHLSFKSKTDAYPFGKAAFSKTMASAKDATTTCHARGAKRGTINVTFEPSPRRKVPKNVLNSP